MLSPESTFVISDATAPRCGVDRQVERRLIIERFLAAVPGSQQRLVSWLLQHPQSGGRGLRMWVNQLTLNASPMPESIPESLVQIYLNDSEALPLHDCEDCGLLVPVRDGRATECYLPENVYFPNCPVCGGRTGLYAFWSATDRRADSKPSALERLNRLRRISR